MKCSFCNKKARERLDHFKLATAGVAAKEGQMGYCQDHWRKYLAFLKGLGWTS